MPRTVRVNDLGEMVGAELGPTRWHSITNRTLDDFDAATGAIRSLRRRAPIGKSSSPRLASLYLLISLIPTMWAEIVVFSDRTRGLNYGLNAARVLHPVPVNSNVRLRGRIDAIVRMTDGGIRYSWTASIDLEGTETPALIGEMIYVLYD